MWAQTSKQFATPQIYVQLTINWTASDTLLSNECGWVWIWTISGFFQNTSTWLLFKKFDIHSSEPFLSNSTNMNRACDHDLSLNVNITQEMPLLREAMDNAAVFCATAERMGWLREQVTVGKPKSLHPLLLSNSFELNPRFLKSKSFRRDETFQKRHDFCFWWRNEHPHGSRNKQNGAANI